MKAGCWARWGLDDWRLLDQDGLVKILAENDWVDRVDAQGRNVLMAAMAQDCNGYMFDQLMLQAASESAVQRALFSHEDAQGVRLAAYAMRHAGRINSASDTIWKAPVMHLHGLDFRNRRGQGLLWQLSKLASATSQPWIWLPLQSPLPITDPDHPAGVGRSIEQWADGMPPRMLEAYVANRLLLHIPGRPRSHAADVHVLGDWFLPLYRQARDAGTLSRWPEHVVMLGRVIQALVGLLSNSLDGMLPPERSQRMILSELEGVWPDLVRLLPLSTRPERHLVKWILENQRLGAHWEGLLLANATVRVSAEGGCRRL